MPIFDNLPRASFSGAEFPVESVRVKGGLRYHVHEYPHIDGGDLEKLGRRLYEIEMRATFQSTGSDADGHSFGNWGPIWPSRLALLRSLFDAKTTATLVIPTIGSIQACCIDWDQEMVAKMRSGENTTFRFIEDQESAFAFSKLVQVKTESLIAISDKVAIQFDRVGVPRSFTDQLLDAVNNVLAIADQVELFGMQVGAKLGLVAALCREFDQRIEQFQNPGNWLALDAMKDLWAATQELATNVDGDSVVFAFYEVKRQSTIAEIATAIYGSTERATELLQLNPIEDAFEVPARTQIRYVVDEQRQAA